MTFLLDVNVLMALLWENHEHHQIARRWLRSAAQDGDSYAMQKRPVILGLVEQRYPSRDPVTAIGTRVRELSELGVLGVRFPEPWLLMLQSLLMSAGLRNSWRLEAVFQN